jgi:hypothetical protein
MFVLTPDPAIARSGVTFFGCAGTSRGQRGLVASEAHSGYPAVRVAIFPEYPTSPEDNSMQNRGKMLIALAALVTIVACGDDPVAPPSHFVFFSATMNFASEVPVPANASTGTGTFTASLDTTNNLFTWDLTFTGLTSNVNNGHIHGPATTVQSAGTTINFNTAPGANFGFGFTNGLGHGSMTLTAATAVTATMNGDSLKKLLFAGLTYANIHTVNNPGGEIRGQIIKQ